MPTYAQLYSTYPLMSNYTSSGKKIWEIETRTGPGIPATVLALDGTDPIATMILSKDPVFYDPMIDESNSNRLVGSDMVVPTSSRTANIGYLGIQAIDRARFEVGDIIDYAGGEVIPAGRYVIKSLGINSAGSIFACVDSTGADGSTITASSFKFVTAARVGHREQTGTAPNRMNIKGTNVVQNQQKLRVENRSDINAVDIPSTIELMFRGGDDFGFFGSPTSKTLFEFFRPYSKFVFYNSPVMVPVESFSVNSYVRTVTTKGDHNLAAGADGLAQRPGTTELVYGPAYTPTTGSRTAGVTTVTIGTHSISVNDQVWITNPLVGKFGSSPTAAEGQTVVGVGATTISYGYYTENGAYFSQAGTTTLVVDCFANHNLTAGQSVYHADAANAWANGNFTVVSTPTAQQYTVTVSTSATYSADFGYVARNVTSTAMTGTVQQKMQPSIWGSGATIVNSKTFTVSDFSANMSTKTVTSGSMWVNGPGAESRVTAESSFFSTIYYTLTGGTTINDGNWHHLAITHEPSSVYADDPNLADAAVVATLYVDGVFQGRAGGSWAGMPTEFSYPGVAGDYDWSSTGSGGMTSEVAHLAIHNRALTQIEISSHAALRSLPPSWQGGYLVFDGSEWRQTLI